MKGYVGLGRTSLRPDSENFLYSVPTIATTVYSLLVKPNKHTINISALLTYNVDNFVDAHILLETM